MGQGARASKPSERCCTKLCAMSPGKTKRELSIAFVVLALSCGGRAESQGSTGSGGSNAAGGVAGSSSSAAGAPGVGPIDTAGLPTELPLVCPDEVAVPKLKLPCKIGGSLLGGVEGPESVNVLECYDSSGTTAFSTVIPFGKLPTLLNQPLQMPFAALPAPPPEGTLKLSGTVTFSKVDPVGRAFVALLVGGSVSYVGSNGETVTCKIPDTPFWAVQGQFI